MGWVTKQTLTQTKSLQSHEDDSKYCDVCDSFNIGTSFEGILQS